MKTKIVLLFLIMITVRSFSEDLNKEVNSVRASFRDGRYVSLIKSSLNIASIASKRIVEKIDSAVPIISNLSVVNSNFSYFCSVDSGFIDYSVVWERVCSNESEILKLSIDTSINSIDRYANLIKSFDFLSDKGDYDKNKFAFKKVSYEYLIDGSSAYLPIIWEKDKETEETKSGILIKLSIEPLKSTKIQDRKKLIDIYLREYITSIKWGELSYSLK